MKHNINFNDLGDGELNLIAAALFREQQRSELGKSYEPPRASSSRARKWSNRDTWQPRGRSASRRRSWKIAAQQLHRMMIRMRMRKGGGRKSSSTGSRLVLPHRKGSSNGSRGAGRGAQAAPPGHQGASRSSRDDPQAAWGQRKRSSSEKPKGKQDVWKDVPQHGRNVHKVGAVRCWKQVARGCSAIAREWPARPTTWSTKGQVDDEATFYIDRLPVKDLEWAIQQSDSNGGFGRTIRRSLSIHRRRRGGRQPLHWSRPMSMRGVSLARPSDLPRKWPL